MLNAAGLPALTVDAGLSKYLTEIRKFPMLRPDEELACARRWREEQDRDAAYRLVTSHLRLVAKIAMRYRGYGLPVSEIVSEGNIGLMQAVKRFDPERGVRLATYAVWWIRATIQEYILRSWSLVKIAASSSQKRLFFKLRRAKGAIATLQDGDLRPEQVRRIAGHLKVAEREVVEMNRRLQGDVSLNLPVRDDGEAGQVLDWLVDPAPDRESTLADEQETAARRQALNEAVAALNARERRIFVARRLKERPATLEELAAEHGVSRERIRQIESRAFQKVKAAIQAATAPISAPQQREAA
ncbi:RNA polymerase sigma factor RpoH [Bradyrhizobium sp.]|uniref:RNA polymerase sigma factor RpoH n=1 Tax=Bradyrhizobium sp. TaxID=376 RepID=UPI0027368B1C|nr:RNA polymerase sigma factor RpoH [Bradyrhizobium sp.]MDP3692771.1 RNA polymerase sigma factor RpoH [Bradyrhizobium sp.]